MELLALPDDCLLLILEKRPLQHLVQLKLVSWRFYNIIQHICVSKQRLKIFGSSYEIQQYIQSLKENYIDHIQDFKIRSSEVLIINKSTSTSIYEIPKR